MTSSEPGRTIGFAHRGARSECRDNTLASFTKALALGARALETDVWLSADGVVVLDHDGAFRVGLRRYPIRSLTHDALPDHVPSLVDLYLRCGTDFELSIDVKDDDAAAPLLALARQVGAASRLWLCSPYLVSLQAWRRLDADANLVHSTTLHRLTGLPHPYRDTSTESVVAILSDHSRHLVACGVSALNLHHQAWNPPSVAAVQSYDVSAFAWDAQKVDALTRLVGMGIDAVYCDDVALMLSVLS
ncbi:MAG: glycerophosphodiester phosphodiesterase [Actinomycetota bacterium]|nr:glycerophosphodiester phosphodiesterase [Actinomycetota bacterium]